jgi:hypothetical protein
MVFGYWIRKCTEYNKTNYISTIYLDITHCVNKMLGWSTFVAKKKISLVLSREKILITIYRDIIKIPVPWEKTMIDPLNACPVLRYSQLLCHGG